MAYTLLDLAALSGSDAVIGLVESALYLAPEMGIIPTLPKTGTSYKVSRRTALPSAQFIQHGAGALPTKSTLVQETKDMYPLLANLSIPELTAEGADDSLTDFLAMEADGAVKGAFFHLAQQMYYGTVSDKFGFPGYVQLINGDPTYEIDAGGASGSSTSAYLVAMHPQGVSMAVGKNGSLSFSPWTQQQIVTGGSSTAGYQTQPAYVSSFKGWFGLTVANQYSVYRVKHIDATHPFNDKLAAQLVSLIPAQFRIGLHWFMNRIGQFSLQNSRSSVGYQPAGATGNPGFADSPTAVAGIPITLTDAISSTEA